MPLDKGIVTKVPGRIFDGKYGETQMFCVRIGTEEEKFYCKPGSEQSEFQRGDSVLIDRADGRRRVFRSETHEERHTHAHVDSQYTRGYKPPVEQPKNASSNVVMLDDIDNEVAVMMYITGRVIDGLPQGAEFKTEDIRAMSLSIFIKLGQANSVKLKLARPVAKFNGKAPWDKDDVEIVEEAEEEEGDELVF
ncbi:MAG: hypothetical protein ACRDEA_00120 [Microcystaceae cyanobacterium]